MATILNVSAPDAAGTPKDHVYSLGAGRLLHTFPVMRTEKPLRRCAAQILLALDSRPFELTVDGATGYYRAVAVKPRVARSSRVRDGVALQIDPSHPQFARFRNIGAAGVLAMDRDAFRNLDTGLHRAYNGRLSIDGASALADDILRIVLSHLPEIRPLDARVTRVVQLYKANPRYPLRELAAAVGVSYYRLSHLFMQEMGISLRSFHLWRKVHAAMKLLGEMSIVEAAQRAGFSDGSHLSHAFRQLHARPPSYFFDTRQVKIVARPRNRRVAPA